MFSAHSCPILQANLTWQQTIFDGQTQAGRQLNAEVDLEAFGRLAPWSPCIGKMQGSSCKRGKACAAASANACWKGFVPGKTGGKHGRGAPLRAGARRIAAGQCWRAGSRSAWGVYLSRWQQPQSGCARPQMVGETLAALPGCLQI